MNHELDLRTQANREAEDRVTQRVTSSAALRGVHPNRGLLGFLTPGSIARILYLDEVYRRILTIPGVIMEFGVQYGSSFAVMSNLRAIHEPYNHTRSLIGFDTFTGFPSVHELDAGVKDWSVGDYGTGEGYEEFLQENVADLEVLAGFPAPRHELVKGDILDTLPAWLQRNPGCLVSMAVIDVDLYEPTSLILDLVTERIPKGGVIAFDELSEPAHPGETIAVLEKFDLNTCRLHRSNLQNNCGYLVVGE